uniref:Uncharacterized protein n=1 Tax=Manihot esculenta TaxID=3983 RepID=A0A2C9U7D2_MANES
MWPIYSTSEEFIAKAPILEPKTQNRTCSSPKICIVCNLPLCSRFFTGIRINFGLLGLILDEISIPLGCLDVYNLALDTSID